MSEEQLNEHPEDKPEDKPPVPLSQTLGFGAGTMLAAYVVSQHGPELASRVREAFPSPAP